MITAKMKLLLFTLAALGLTVVSTSPAQAWHFEDVEFEGDCNWYDLTGYATAWYPSTCPGLVIRYDLVVIDGQGGVHYISGEHEYRVDVGPASILFDYFGCWDFTPCGNTTITGTLEWLTLPGYTCDDLPPPIDLGLIDLNCACGNNAFDQGSFRYQKHQSSAPSFNRIPSGGDLYTGIEFLNILRNLNQKSKVQERIK